MNNMESVARLDVLTKYHQNPTEFTQLLIILYSHATGRRPRRTTNLLKWFFAHYQFSEGDWYFIDPYATIH